MENEPQNYEMRCVECGKSKNLYMLPHRDKNGNMVGVLYTCGDCMETVRGSECIIDARRDEEIAALKADIEYYKNREQKISKMLNITDNGKYINDWESAVNSLKDKIERKDKLIILAMNYIEEKSYKGGYKILKQALSEEE